MNEFLNNTWAFWGLVIFAIGLTLLVVVPTSSGEETDNPQFQEDNTISDEVDKIIVVKLQDGISSGDKLK